MTKYHELQVSANKKKKRVGRGISAGQGKTAGRGTKGQGSRTGKKLSHTFMGGQGSLVQRIPKGKGFKSLRVPAQVVYLDQLNIFKGKIADNFTLAEVGLVASPHHTVKVIARGEIEGKVTLKVQLASASAQESIKKAGGTFMQTPVPLKENTKKKSEK